MEAPDRLADLGEEEVVARLLARLDAARSDVAAGDDCAVVRVGGENLLLKTDAVIEGVHYLSDTEPARVGWKAVARVASDFAAMGGAPGEYLVTLALPGHCPMTWVEGLYDGMMRCAEDFGGAIVGGETVGLPADSPAMISIAGTGRAANPVLRSGGDPGDSLWVTGRLGGSFASGRHLDFSPRVKEGTWLAAYARAMMDLSDGLARDLPRLAKASGCGYRLEPEAIPRHEGCSLAEAMGDGEDFELLFAAPEGDWADEFRVNFPNTGLTRIGTLVADGEGDAPGEAGWQHFKS